MLAGFSRALGQSSRPSVASALANSAGVPLVARGFASKSTLQQRKQKNRPTWKQQANHAAAKRAAQLNGSMSQGQGDAPKLPREKKRNYLIQPPLEDGKKWRILSASIVERIPVIQDDVPKWAEDFMDIQQEIALRYAQRVPGEFWTSEAGDVPIEPEDAPKWNEPTNPEELFGNNEVPLAPRETEDDRLNNRKSLNRALKKRVFLLVKNKTPAPGTNQFEWFFPVGPHQQGEKMRDTAVRELQQLCGDDMELWPQGFAPIGHVQVLDDKQTDGFDGTKVFFYKTQRLDGQVDPTEDSPLQDYVWVTRDELKEYLHPDIVDTITKIVPP